MRRRRAVRFRLAASTLLLVLFAAGAELAARAVGADLPGWRLVADAGFVLGGHPTRLWGLLPGVKRSPEATVTVNERGLRGPVPEVPKPAGRLRLLVLGDSTWFGHGVNDDETFAVQLEARLEAGGLDVEVVNAAVPGYSTEQSRLFLEEEGFDLEPDLLLVGNLWSDNNVDSFRDADLMVSARAAAENPLYASHFFRLLVSQVDRARGGTGARLVTWTKSSTYPEKGDRRVPIQRYAENLDWMAREAARRGAGIAFLGPCNRGSVDGTYQRTMAWDTYFSAQGAVAAHHGVPAIATLPAMRAAAAQGGGDRLFVSVMHPSAEGHAVFAATVADGLATAGWPGVRLVARGGPFPYADLVDRHYGLGEPDPTSLQRNLFGERRLPAPTASAPASTVADPENGPGAAQGVPSAAGVPADAGGPAPAAPTAGGDATTPARPDADERWTVAGTVVNGEGPLLVELRAPGGSAFSSARLARPGPFSLRISRDLAAVDVVVTDAGGRVARRAVRRGENAGDVRFGD